MADPEEARRAIAGLAWWHAIEVAPGVVTPGGWDLRPVAARLPWPGPLDGLRCLDVGTMDGFWAFELERRGAAEVVAIDIAHAGEGDRRTDGSPARPGPPRGETFAVAAGLLGSRAQHRSRNVYDLDPEADGEFDVVVMGYVLQLLRDPLRGLEAVRRVCRGHLLLLDTVSLPLSLLPAPLARLDARRPSLEWFVFNRRGLARAVDVAGFDVEAVTPVLRDAAGQGGGAAGLDRVRHRLGLLGRSAALRARARR